jgi:hypothetical protein
MYVIRVRLSLHNCEIYYLAAVNYYPDTKDLIFIRVNIYPGPGEGGFMLTCLIYQGHYFILQPYLTALAEVPNYPGGQGELVYCHFSTHLFYQGHNLPCGLTPQY